MAWLRGFAWVALATGLAGCASDPMPAVARVEAPPPRDLLAEVRAAAAMAGDVIEVVPLRDPGVDDLLGTAERAEAQRKWKRADRALREALALTPEDPELLQRRAEVLLAQFRFDEAEAFAQQSFERGPRLGGLCRRNWATLRLVREQRGDQPGVDSAHAQFARCLVEVPVRM